MKKGRACPISKELSSLSPEGERRDIFLRAHTAKIVQKQPRKSKRTKKMSLPEKWPERALIFDTETRTTLDQRLTFAIYRICRLAGDKYLCEEEGLVYSDSVENLPSSYSAVFGQR